MPKLTFSNKEEFGRWLLEATERKNYELYIDETNLRLVAIPTVSTPPICYGVVETLGKQELENLAQDLSNKLGLPLYRLKELEFSDFRTR